MEYDAVFRSPFGYVGVTVGNGAVTAVDWLAEHREREPRDALAAETVRQLRAWFDEPRQPFDLPLAPADTPFRARMREAMCAIPPGRTRTYGEIAAEIGSVARAVGGACRHNPLAIIVPCHRVVARDGIGGYSGDWGRGAALSHKQRLLALERVAG